MLSFADGSTGTVTFSGGTGRFRGFHASVAVTYSDPWHWDGTYWLHAARPRPVGGCATRQELMVSGPSSSADHEVAPASVVAGSALYVNNAGDGTVSVITTATGAVSPAIPVATARRNLAARATVR